MNNAEISRAVRTARKPLRQKADSWRLAVVGLLAVSVIGNAAQYGAMLHSDKLHRAEISQYQQEIEYAKNVKNQAVQKLGKFAKDMAFEKLAAERQSEAYEAISAYQYVGQCQITYYCPCSKCCGSNADGLTATGISATPGVVAVDPEIIPLGSTVIIGGQRYLAADTGSAVKGLHIDICVADHSKALSGGLSVADVWTVVE